jgi:uncharacterized membrane protein
MSRDRQRAPALEQHLATTLQLGTWVGSCVVALGWVLSATGKLPAAGTAIIQAGIALFILLPAFRVLLMILAFIRERDYRFAAVAAVVLTIIAVGAAFGVHMTGGLP